MDHKGYSYIECFERAEKRFAPLTRALAAHGLDASVTNTGGMVMCLELELGEGRRVLLGDPENEERPFAGGCYEWGDGAFVNLWWKGPGQAEPAAQVAAEHVARFVRDHQLAAQHDASLVDGAELLLGSEVLLDPTCADAASAPKQNVDVRALQDAHSRLVEREAELRKQWVQLHCELARAGEALRRGEIDVAKSAIEKACDLEYELLGSCEIVNQAAESYGLDPEHL